MQIDSIEDLEAVENKIRLMIQQHDLENVLLGLRQASDKLEPFMIAGITLFAIRHCTAGHRTPTYRALELSRLAPLADLVTQYLLTDPLTFDPTIQQDFYNSNLAFTMLRLVGSQMPYNISLFGQHAQPLILYHEIPKQLAERINIPRFDFEASFEKINGVSLTDFIKAGFAAFIAAKSHQGFTRSYFERARSEGINLPEDKDIVLALDKLAADTKKLKKLYRSYRLHDRRFGMYDFNPLFLHPIVRPWRQKKAAPIDQDRMIAPIPELIAFRISMGIYYQMFNRYGNKFSNYFGHVFEAYVGRILQNSVPAGTLLSEDDIRKTYPTDRGKVSDWIIIEGSTAILIECKATRFSRAALTTGTEDVINDSLKQVMKGLRQLHEFREACTAKQPGLEASYACTEFRPVLITLEPLYLVNSDLFREHIDDKLAAEGITNLPWLILAVDELEKLQPHMAAGIGLDKILDDRNEKPLNTILEELHSQTGRTYKDSFLYDAGDRELYERLGLKPVLERCIKAKNLLRETETSHPPLR